MKSSKPLRRSATNNAKGKTATMEILIGCQCGFTAQITVAVMKCPHCHKEMVIKAQ